jgi:hypothetical protein
MALQWFSHSISHSNAPIQIPITLRPCNVLNHFKMNRNPPRPPSSKVYRPKNYDTRGPNYSQPKLTRCKKIALHFFVQNRMPITFRSYNALKYFDHSHNPPRPPYPKIYSTINFDIREACYSHPKWTH